MSSLGGSILAVQSSDIYGTLEAISPESISGTISGILYKDLQGSINGFCQEVISGGYIGHYKEDLIGKISGRDSTSIKGFISGFFEIGAVKDLNGYIKEKLSYNQSIYSTILGVSYKSVSGIVHGMLPGSEDIYGQTSGIPNPIGDINGQISCKFLENHNIGGQILGQNIIDLYGEYIVDPNSSIIGKIQGSYIPTEDVTGSIKSVQELGLGGSITLASRLEFIEGNIIPIPAVNLYGSIEPDVYYIESSIPINTYLVQELSGFINASTCLPNSSLSNLYASISGVRNWDLYGKITSVAGQYATSKDYINIILNNRILLEDWMLILLEPPKLYENFIPITFSQSPLYDITGFIEGIPNTYTLSGSIKSLYSSSIPKKSSPLGTLVNTKTGDTKVLNIFFKGSADTFYYSSGNQTVYSANSDDKLILIVESYTKDALESNSLLMKKGSVRQCEINNLQEFSSVDAAIKFAIICAANQIGSELSASIEAVGGHLDLSANITPIDTRLTKDIIGKIIPIHNLPDILGIVNSKGSFKELISNITSNLSAQTYNIMGDSVVLLPRLVLHGDNEYSIILTREISNGKINISPSPDLSGHIIGYRVEDISATISGL